MKGISDLDLLEIAEKIPGSMKYLKLALLLNISAEDAMRFQKNQTNGEYNVQGTWAMLHDWKENTKDEDQREQLKRALENAQLGRVADQYFVQNIPNNGLTTHTESTSVFVFGPAVSVGLLRQLVGLTERLKKRYTHSDRFSDDILLRKRDFRPTLKRRDGSGRSLYSMENSRHDIFASSTASQQPRRKLVSSNNTADKTGLCHSMAYDWATQNSASTLSEMGYLFEISASQIKKDQTIEGAIKDQLFSDLEEVDEGMIGQLLNDFPDAITVLVDGYDVQHAEKYGKNIMRVLTGCALQEVNIMVTTRPRSAANLTRLASGVYDHIVMQNTSTAGERCAVETTKVELSTRMVEAHLERLYTDPKRFLEGIVLRKRDFQPTLKRRDGSSNSGCAMENSRHDIFASSTASQQPRRIVVSGSNAADNTGLCHSLSDDWVIENSSSILSEMQYLLEISASRIRENQTIEGAIKDQLFSDLHEIDEDKVRQMLKDMPDAITILFDGFDGKHIRTYGDYIMKVLTGRALPEVTVMVTARPRSANQLHRLAPNLYDHINMQ